MKTKNGLGLAPVDIYHRRFDNFTKHVQKLRHGQKGAGSFHIHRKIMKELGALAVLEIRERPNLAQNLVTHRH